MGIVNFDICFKVRCVQYGLVGFKVFEFFFVYVQEYIVNEEVVLWIFGNDLDVGLVFGVGISLYVVYVNFFVIVVFYQFSVKVVVSSGIKRFVNSVLVYLVFGYFIFNNEVVLW